AGTTVGLKKGNFLNNAVANFALLIFKRSLVLITWLRALYIPNCASSKSGSPIMIARYMKLRVSFQLLEIMDQSSCPIGKSLEGNSIHRHLFPICTFRKNLSDPSQRSY